VREQLHGHDSVRGYRYWRPQRKRAAQLLRGLDLDPRYLRPRLRVGCRLHELQRDSLRQLGDGYGPRGDVRSTGHFHSMPPRYFRDGVQRWGRWLFVHRSSHSGASRFHAHVRRGRQRDSWADTLLLRLGLNAPPGPSVAPYRPLSAPASSRASGTLRIHATDDVEFADFVTRSSVAGGVTIAHPNPPPVGTSVRLEVISKETKERICAVDVVVQSIVPAGEKPSPSMVLSITRIALGCSENVRQALARSMPLAPAKRTNDRGRVIGIDLGTTFSCAAIVENDEPRVIQSRLGYSTIPSVLTFDDQGVPVVGQVAERRLVLQPDRVVYGSKRLIGRTFSNAVSQAFSARVPYKVVADPEGMSAIQLGARVLSPVEIAACVLSEVRRMAEEALQEPVTRAVVTVPAAFTQNQRAAVREAGARAGLDILRTVNEPTAATLAFGYGRGIRKKVLVFDLGGGTFDVSILALDGNVSTVLATLGDTFLGGLDFDEAMVVLLMAALREQFGNVRVERLAAERIRAAAKEAKHALSETQRANVAIPKLQIEGGTSGAVDFSATIARDQFEAMTAPLIDRTIKTCEEALAIAKLGPGDIEDVLLVGGQTRMPAIAQRLQAYFKRPPSKRVHPDEVVALGAAILATTFEREDAPVLLDVLSTPIGIVQPRHDASGAFAQRQIAGDGNHRVQPPRRHSSRSSRVSRREHVGGRK
jgi:molecular chaperone DnaK